MLCPGVMPKDTVGPQSGDPMPRRLDHLVICVHDLAQAALDWQTLGFNLTPTGVHPFGTSNRLAMFGNNSLTQVPLRPCCRHSKGDFINAPTWSGKNPVLLSKPSSVFPSRLIKPGL